jgi:putative transposase
VKTKLSLDQREFHCQRCGLRIDRDLNASINLAGLAGTVAASGAETQNARTGQPPREAGTGQPDKTGTASPTTEAA